MRCIEPLFRPSLHRYGIEIAPPVVPVPDRAAVPCAPQYLEVYIETAVGLTFGFWPTMREVRLNPIEVLHYE